MAYKAESFISDLDKVAKARQEFSRYLSAITNTLTQAEEVGETASGKACPMPASDLKRNLPVGRNGRWVCMP